MSRFGYCLNASTIRGTPILDQIKVASAAGYKAIELWFADLDEAMANGVTLTDVRRCLADEGVIAATMIYLGDWFDATDSDWPKTRSLCVHRLEQAAAIGAKYVIAGPPGCTADVSMGARRYRKLLEAGVQIGALPAMEFLGFVQQFRTIESVLEVLDFAAHPAGTVVVDPFHIFRGGGSLESLTKLRGDQVAVAHFDDAPSKPRREEQHDVDRVWPGDGQLNLRRYCALLSEIGYRGWLSLELFSEELWRCDPLIVARTGLEKMRAAVEA